jgi:hypothetical protein
VNKPKTEDVVVTRFTIPRPVNARIKLRDTLILTLGSFTLHEVLHSLVEVCYHHAADYERDVPLGVLPHNGLQAHNWRVIANLLTNVEASCASLAL